MKNKFCSLGNLDTKHILCSIGSLSYKEWNQHLSKKYNSADYYKEIIFFYLNNSDELYCDEKKLELCKRVLQNDEYKYNEGQEFLQRSLYGRSYVNFRFPFVFKKPVIKIEMDRTEGEHCDFLHFHFGQRKYSCVDHDRIRKHFIEYASADFDTENPFGFAYKKYKIGNELKDLLEEKTKNNIVYERHTEYGTITYPYLTHSPFQEGKCGYVAISFDAFCCEHNNNQSLYFTNDVVMYFAVLERTEEEYLRHVELLGSRFVNRNKTRTLKEKNQDDIFFDELEVQKAHKRYIRKCFFKAFNLIDGIVDISRTKSGSKYRYFGKDDPHSDLERGGYILVEYWKNRELYKYFNISDAWQESCGFGYDKEEDAVKFVYHAVLNRFSYELEARFNFEKNKDVLPKVLVDAIMEIKENTEEEDEK